MTHSHAHSGPSARDPGAGGNVGGLRAALVITSGVGVLEAVGGWLTGSMALLADAGHMLTDAGALGIALFAAWIGTRPRNARMSFGYGRAEILGALANGLLLGGVSVAIALESLERIASPHAVAAGPMIAIATIGLIANLISARLLSGTAKRNLNVRAALFHVLGDALGSVAAIGAGLAILIWDFGPADAAAGLVIALLLVASAFRLIRESVDILLEGAPGHLDLREIARRVREIPGVMDIHDLHIWTVREGFLAMSAHLDLEPGASPETVRRAAHRLLHQGYNIMHTTIQTEEATRLLAIEPDPSTGRT